MNKFEKQLEKWNNGVLRGAQAKLAKTLGVSTATTALWTTGKRHPSKGYVDRMAELFDMDVFGVLKLFESVSTTYPDPKACEPLRTLRDQNTADCSYHAGVEKHKAPKLSAQLSNSVSLPFLDAPPLAYPRYEDGDVIEWWSVPRRFARGARYIIRCKDGGLPDAHPDDLCLIKPASEFTDGALMLLSGPKGFLLRRVTLHGEHVTLLGPLNTAVESYPAGRLHVLGMAVRKITAI